MVSFIKYLLQFKQPAGTSRGTLLNKETYILRWHDPETGKVAFGECNLFRGLSADDRIGYREKLADVCRTISLKQTYNIEDLREWPSIAMGVETLLRDKENGCEMRIFKSDFEAGRASISINGLIWMGPKKSMVEQVKAKLREGFTCIKLKIGAIDFDSELEVLRFIRREFGVEDIEIRVDANGAFTAEEAPEKLKRLSDFQLHSIEQPIRAGQWENMAAVVANSPVPVALDEELIGVNSPAQKQKMLETIRPPYIILKPALAGGFAGCDEWIDYIERQGGKWWITSALESNIGLNAVAQFAAATKNRLPQGLGTGALYTNNFPSPLEIQAGQLLINTSKSWDLTRLL